MTDEITLPPKTRLLEEAEKELHAATAVLEAAKHRMNKARGEYDKQYRAWWANEVRPLYGVPNGGVEPPPPPIT